MNKPDLNNPETATDLPQDKRELIKQMQHDFKTFNEQEKLFAKLHSTVYDGYLHPELLKLFLSIRGIGNAERLAEKQNTLYFKLMRLQTFEGLNFHEIAMVFNFIEGLSANEAVQCGISEELFLDIFEQTYNESALNVWNKQVDAWREEIAIEKQGMVNAINKLVEELNKDVEALNAKRKKSNPKPIKAAYVKKDKEPATV